MLNILSVVQGQSNPKNSISSLPVVQENDMDQTPSKKSFSSTNSQDKECSQCTFKNPKTAIVCQVCQTTLS